MENELLRIMDGHDPISRARSVIQLPIVCLLAFVITQRSTLVYFTIAWTLEFRPELDLNF